ncbi:hypothetical protein WL31_20945 [Burkholderia ubonensis]|nr:hypothetical protein WL31_20945 [Burkholderia ubonensis]
MHKRHAASGFVADAGHASTAMHAPGRNDGKDAATLGTPHRMAVQRHADAVMLEIVSGFDDVAHVVGGVAQTGHFAALLGFHQRLVRGWKSFFYLARK